MNDESSEDEGGGVVPADAPEGFVAELAGIRAGDNVAARETRPGQCMSSHVVVWRVAVHDSR